MKKIPYGIANFEKIKENGDYYYVDKTKYIEELENLGGQYLFFLRPRRFGKSLFISMLEHYYDINRKEQFHQLFGDTYIGINPTKLKNSFPILKLNFSGIPTDKDVEQIENSFNIVILGNIEIFFSKYSKIYNITEDVKKEVLNTKNAGDMLNRFISKMSELGIKYYLLIDEYDNFANNILVHHGKERYMRVTHQAGFLRSFFAAIKVATESRAVERLFVTGVSPLVLSDVTSGMNIGDNISPQIIFNSMIGFNQNEVEEMLDYYITEKLIKTSERVEILELFKANYNNYCFSDNTSEKVYNSDMILYFFNKFSQEKKIPNSLIDENVRIDYGKLKFLVLADRKLNGNFSILSELVEKGEVDTELIHSFALSDIVEKSKFKSFLYYLGLVTLKKHLYGNEYMLTIPNETINTMMVNYIRQGLDEIYDLTLDVDFLQREYKKLAFNGEWQPIIGYILEKFYEATSLRDFILREHSIKMFMLAYLNVTPLYFVESEPELNKGYADIFLRKNYSITDLTKFEYIIELKYIKAEEYRKISLEEKKSGLVIEEVPENHLAKVKKEAIDQLERYAKSKKITCNLKKVVIICSAKELLVLEEVK
ncbi:MAG: AAA family ATPase [Candidatus Delongbacteria bacterium]|nr:AAA family ATPase [Candidatus Delongbacteria bacterium]MBN2834380.1 AAA family ATPase [Candidatus Delongbacteria bacterium]